MKVLERECKVDLKQEIYAKMDKTVDALESKMKAINEKNKKMLNKQSDQ